MIPLYDQNPASTRPFVTRTLIYVNVVVFLLQWWLEMRGVPWVAEAYGMVPSRLSVDPLGEWPKLLGSAFLHGGWAHLGWNMLFLHIFGDNVEDRMGRDRYLVFYLLSAFAAALAQYAIDPLARTPMVGASGAIAGVLGAYLVLYPRAPIAVVNPILPLWLLMGPLFALPAWFVVGMWFLGNVSGGLASLGGSGAGGVAFFAHLGGFCAGLLLVRPFQRATARDSRHTDRATTRVSNRRGAFWKNDGGPFWK
ncbi:MAG TPA: rhomboid family intramembrane serine protease [Polyangiaceae bacterium]|nr:rhomboid family intramembrane serine protease [Polyangiaceae bacterium]